MAEQEFSINEMDELRLAHRREVANQVIELRKKVDPEEYKLKYAEFTQKLLSNNPNAVTYLYSTIAFRLADPEMDISNAKELNITIDQLVKDFSLATDGVGEENVVAWLESLSQKKSETTETGLTEEPTKPETE